MRDFEQTKAEIFRRSEERIQKRKKIRRMTVLCVPLVLCVAVAALLPRQEIAQANQEEIIAAAGVHTAGGAYSTTEQSTHKTSTESILADVNRLATVRLCSAGVVLWEKSGEAAEEILALLETMTVCVKSESDAAGDNYTTRGEVMENMETAEITLCIIDETGAEQEFLWEATGLTDLQTGEIYLLTAAQQKKLESLLE